MALLMNQVTATFTDEGMVITEMDNGHCVLCSLELGFQRYHRDFDRRIGFSLPFMCRILKAANNGNFVTFCLKRGFEAQMEIIIEDDKGNYICKGRLPLWRQNVHRYYPFDNVSQKLNTINMDSAEFQKMCRDLSWIGPLLTVTCEQNSVTFESNGETGMGFSITRKPDDKFKASFSGTVTKSSHSLSYINFFTKGASLSRKVRICVTPQQNLMTIIYTIPYTGQLSFLITDDTNDNDEDDNDDDEEEEKDDDNE
jgi:proliferating cell nuclear antigen